MNNEMLGWAKKYAQAGLSVLPIRPESKKAAVKWDGLQEKKPTEEQLKSWFEGANYGLGLVLSLIHI